MKECASLPPTGGTASSSTAQWEQLWDVFHSILEAHDGEREARLAELPTSIASEVRGLLAAHRSSGDFLPSPRLGPPGVVAGEGVGATESGHPVNPLLGRQVGPYVVRQVLGEGGMGIVFLADQERPVRRRVALKVLKRASASPQVVARFEAERQALVMMGHPNVAAALDTGSTDDGRPYLAMEYVAGLPIDVYCDRFRCSLEERLRWMLDVCRGVAHAHLRGVVHRDLKPSNLLVTVVDGEVVPKVIDFGIAKAIGAPLTDRPAVTELGALVGTPEYMSPEQADRGGLDVGPASDIYSLGVVLYRLLAGVLPFRSDELRSGGYGHLCRMLLERTPQPPSERFDGLDEEAKQWIATCRQQTPNRLRQALGEHLDPVILRCLEKDPTRRPPTVQALAEELASICRQGRGDLQGLVAVPHGGDAKLRVPSRAAATSARQRRGLWAVLGGVLLLWVGAAWFLGQPRPPHYEPTVAGTGGGQVAITVDDVPSMADDLTLNEVRELNTRILDALLRSEVPAVAFVTGEDLDRPHQRQERRHLVEQWVEAGFEIGNHTFSHGSYHALREDAFRHDVLRADALLRELLPGDRPPRYFRHPFLHTGRDAAHRQALEAFLRDRGYTVAPVTVEAQDYLFDDAYRRAVARGDQATAGRLVDAYLQLNGEAFEYSEALADTLFDEPIPQVLLIHATQLNAASLPRLLQSLRRRGYRFIGLAEALRHPAYAAGAEDGGVEGLTWPLRWTVARGLPVSWASEPQAPEWVVELAADDP